MRYWVAVTDNAWFRFLSELQPDEVNFWQPGGQSRFRAVEQGIFPQLEILTACSGFAGACLGGSGHWDCGESRCSQQ